MKTYLKTLERMFSKHVSRLISMILIVLVSVGFCSGIGLSVDKIEYSMTDYYKAQNVSDFIIKDTGSGFTEEEIAAVKERYGEECVESGMSVDVYLTVEGERQLFRLYFLDDYGNQTINVYDVLEEGTTEGIAVSAEDGDNKISGLALGTEISLDFKDILTQLAAQNSEELDETFSSYLDNLETVTVTVNEIVQSPLTFALDGEPSYLNPEDTEIPDTVNGVNELICVENILYLPSSVIPTYSDIIPESLKAFLSDEQIEELLGSSLDEKLLGTGDLYVAVSDRTIFNGLSSRYETYTESEAQSLVKLLNDVEIITLFENYSFYSLKSYADKVLMIGYLLIFAFLFVTALVVFSTMTRLFDEERSQIACLKTLGYSSFKIVFKYLLFALIAVGIGGAGAYFVGIGIAHLIYYVFNYCYVMPPVSSMVAIGFFLVAFFVIVLAAVIATIATGMHMTNQPPAELLRPKVPKAGKKVFLERIPLLWNRISFKYKSTLRNVLRYKYRFLMTVISVAVSMSLVLVGLELLDICIFGGLNSLSIMAIAVVVVIFAGLLTAVVIYTLTNINISERNRELATLMVLGYHDNEVGGYIYREIYIDTIVGMIFGYPLSLFLMNILFDIIGMGTIGGVNWFVWVLSPVIVLLFTFLITVMLRKKIVSIDMNESLKAVE